MTDRTATTVWTGDVKSGSGEVTLDTSGTGRFSVSLPSRVGEANGSTSPEELIAAAHSSCYSMQLSSLLSRAGTPPEEIRTSATATVERQESGLVVTGIALTVRARVPSVDADGFAQVAQQAKDTCPVSVALRATPITLDAALEG